MGWNRRLRRRRRFLGAWLCLIGSRFGRMRILRRRMLGVGLWMILLRCWRVSRRRLERTKARRMGVGRGVGVQIQETMTVDGDGKRSIGIGLDHGVREGRVGEDMRGKPMRTTMASLRTAMARRVENLETDIRAA